MKIPNKQTNKQQRQQIAFNHSSDIMTNNNKIRDEKLQYNINREAAKI